MENTRALREQILRQLRNGHAYETFEAIVSEVPAGKRGVVPPGAEHSAWQILEHMRIALRDILDFSRNEDASYVKKRWPDDYWPASPTPPDAGAWDRSIQQYLSDRREMEALVEDTGRDLFLAFPWGDGQTLLREALLAADHASYHLGQMVVISRLLAD